MTDGPTVHAVPLGQHTLDALVTLEGVKADLAHVAALGRPQALDGTALADLQASAAAVYHEDVIVNEIVGNDVAAIVDNLIAVRSRPEWGVGKQITATVVYFHGGNLYRAIQTHTAQADWAPGLPGTDALWARFYEPEAGPQPWVQPQGAHDAYNIPDRVTFGGQTWQTTIDANVWQPGVFGWVVV